jgi:hypothetical protein
VTWVKVDIGDGFVQRINLDKVVVIHESPAEEGEFHSPTTVEIYTTAPDSMYVDELPPEARVQACPYVISLWRGGKFLGADRESVVGRIRRKT